MGKNMIPDVSPGRNWGSDVIPPESRVSLDRLYQTRSGKQVILYEIRMLNNTDNEVTFPVKGSVIEKREFRSRRRYQIWTLDGRASVLGDHADDLFPAS